MKANEIRIVVSEIENMLNLNLSDNNLEETFQAFIGDRYDDNSEIVDLIDKISDYVDEISAILNEELNK